MSQAHLLLSRQFYHMRYKLDRAGYGLHIDNQMCCPIVLYGCKERPLRPLVSSGQTQQRLKGCRRRDTFNGA